MRRNPELSSSRQIEGIWVSRSLVNVWEKCVVPLKIRNGDP